MTLVFIALFGLMLLGVPVAFAILSAGMTYLAATGASILVVPQRLIFKRGERVAAQQAGHAAQIFR